MDFVKLEYTANVKDGRVFDTTDGDVAKKEDVFDDKRVYRPLPVIVGEGQVVKGLDEVLKDLLPGEEKTLELAPEKAFGGKDAGLIKLVPIKVFKQQGITPIPGMPVELDGRQARVQTVAGGRVRVDFNHPLAGKTVVYNVKIVSKAGSDSEKIKFLVERSFNESDDFKTSLNKKKLSVELPEKVYRDRNILARKASLSAEVFKYLKLSDVTYTEIWKNPETGKKPVKEKKE